MELFSKKELSEADIKRKYITPAIEKKWNPDHIRMEAKITDGRINLKGNNVVRERCKYADYLLYLNNGKPIAVVEAKDNNHLVSEGIKQAKEYAEMMDIQCVYSSNGDAFHEYDLLTRKERVIPLD
ncbi:MAG: type I restriction enzyme HsdR N-terminal domain-containing protein [Methanomicrobium sp.]|nr:type I restriction enzyme HsdR N-terminal domain-containing protein [Methanomicrobium sp.]